MLLSELIKYYQGALEEIGEDVEIIFEDYHHKQFELMFMCQENSGQHKQIIREVLWDQLK